MRGPPLVCLGSMLLLASACAAAQRDAPRASAEPPFCGTSDPEMQYASLLEHERALARELAGRSVHPLGIQPCEQIEDMSYAAGLLCLWAPGAKCDGAREALARSAQRMRDARLSCGAPGAALQAFRVRERIARELGQGSTPWPRDCNLCPGYLESEANLEGICRLLLPGQAEPCANARQEIELTRADLDRAGCVCTGG